MPQVTDEEARRLHDLIERAGKQPPTSTPTPAQPANDRQVGGDHYRAAAGGGNGGKQNDSRLKQFWSKVDFKGPRCGNLGRCWEHTAKNPGKSLKARVSYRLNVGSIGQGMHVCHHCDNPKCVRPSHLFLGTNNDNRQDSVSKDRHARGERHGMAKLTDEQVAEIRRRYKRVSYHVSNKNALAEEFGVHPEHIGLLVRGVYRKRKTNYGSK